MPASSTGWFPVARSTDVGTTPLPVGAGDRAFVVVRLRPGGEVSAFPARCPHRLVPLAAATVADGRLRCRYHGWAFDAEGRCVDIPSLGPEGTPSPRADLPLPWAVDERHGWVWLAPDRTSTPAPPRPTAVPTPEPTPDLPEPTGPVLGNLDPSLDAAWHPVALSRELRPGGWLQVRLLDRTWLLRRTDDGLAVDPPAHGVRERHGVVELAPAEPSEQADAQLDVPELGDRRFVSGWLPALRSPGAAANLIDALVDAAHGVAPGELPAATLTEQPGGFTGVHEAGGRRTTVAFRVPFRLRLREEDPATGVVSTALFMLQPEDADSTRIYTRLLLSAGPGRPLPAPAAVVQQMAEVHARLDDEIRLMAEIRSAGLPLDQRNELHVPADRLGLALRGALCDFTLAGRESAAA